MKNFLVLIVATGFLYACDIFFPDNTEEKNDDRYEAQIMKRQTFENSISLQNAKAMKQTGKIYVIENYLFINEPHVGFHIIDNTNPAKPTPVKFLNTPGASDLISKGEFFYINQAVDLVALRFTNSFSAVSVTKRVKNIFPEVISPQGDLLAVKADEVVVKWNLKN